MAATDDHSRVPAHLQPLHRPPPLTPASTKTRPSAEVQSQISISPELYPHWQVPRRRSLKSTLKSIITKDWPTLLEQSPPQQRLPTVRPPMRMKDSDDYITARAANPRTGLISPSVGTRTPCTPDSPGDALKLRAHEHHSPTPHTKTRPSLSRANEGRKISGGSTRTKRTDINGMQWNPPQTVTSGHEVGQDHVRWPSPALTEDSFVVHMPSAREPQPFAYPGYSAEQIAALEHYQRKTRRVSNEGYDRRLLSNGGTSPATLSAAECDNTPTDENDPMIYTCPTGQHFIAYRYPHHDAQPQHEQDELPRLTVRKRKTQVDKIRQELNDSPAEAEAKKVFLASPSPTRITTLAIDSREDNNSRNDDHVPRTAPQSPEGTGACSHSYLSSCPKHAQICSATGEISGKQIFGSAPSCTAAVANGAPSDDRHHADGGQKTPSQPAETVVAAAVPARKGSGLCGLLPRVRLVRPEFAAVPREARGDGEKRECSFGCRRDGKSGECAERRKPSSSSTVLLREEDSNRQVSTSFVDHAPERERASSNDSCAWITLVLSTVAYVLLDYARSVQAQIPKWIDVVVEMFVAPSEGDGSATAKEKLEALKALVSLLGHALAVCTALAMVWKIAIAVLNLLEVVLWPLAVPLRIVRFMIGLG